MAFDGVKRRLEAARERWPLLDHAIRTVRHYGGVRGGQHAGGVTYFAFLSVFPVLALAFFAVGWIARVYPDANDALVKAIEDVLPGIIGDKDNEISLGEIEDAGRIVGPVGLVGVLYAGLGWLSALRSALVAVFEEPERMLPGFLVGKVRDLMSLVVLGVVLLTSVGVSGVATRISGWILEELGLGAELGWLLWVLGIVLGVAASTLMFLLMFRLLAQPPTPRRSLWAGALLGGVGFELLKQLSGVLLSSTRGQPAFQAFGIALILLVWINYFSQIVLYAAAWAHTSPAARASRVTGPASVQGPQSPPLAWRERIEAEHGPSRGLLARSAAPFVAGAATVVAAAAVLKRKPRS